MENKEKSALLEGNRNWYTHAIPGDNLQRIILTDGPHGLRLENPNGKNKYGLGCAYPSTCFPTAVNLASSFDRSLAEEEGFVLGQECLHYQVSVILGPGINIKRNPLCGRNFEYFSEDPLLSGILSGSLVKGIQKTGVSACLKHFVCNNTEDMKLVNDSIVDPRALHEIYLRNFCISMSIAKPDTVMCAYNSVNGIPCAQNKELLKYALRDEMGYDKVIMTDWGAMRDRTMSIEATLDLEMPGMVDAHRRDMIEKCKSDPRFQKAFDDSYERMSALVKKGMTSRKETGLDVEEHADAALKVALESAVLLKNEGRLLPLDPKREFLVIGSFFDDMRYQGAGSSLISPLVTVTPKEAFEKHGVQYRYAKGFDSLVSEKKNRKLKEEALKQAKTADRILLFLGLDDFHEMEGQDRKNLSLPKEQLELVQDLIRLKKEIAVVLFNGSPVELPFLPDIKSVLEMYLPGEMGGEAVYRLLFGLDSPCGKLAETWPRSLQDVPFIDEYGKKREEYYKEGIFVGYRYYLSHPEKILFPFGFGLSYTRFRYSDLETELKKDEVIVRYKIKNIGSLSGKEISEVYVSLDQSKTYRPIRELKGFDKTRLEPGETKEVVIHIPLEWLRYYEPNLKRFVLEEGRFEFEIGSSSTQIELRTALSLNGEKVIDPLSNPKYGKVELKDVTLEDFKEIYPDPFPEPVDLEAHPEEKMISEFDGTFGKLISFVLKRGGKHRLRKAMRVKDKKIRKEMMKNAYFYLKSIDNSPLIFVANNSGGKISVQKAKALAKMCNGHFLSGLKEYLKKEEPRLDYPDKIENL